MPRNSLTVLYILFLSSCGTTYYYYPPPVNNTCYNQKGEFLAGFQAGNTGTFIKTGYSMGDQVALSVNFFNGRGPYYRSSEQEFAFIFTHPDSNDARFNVMAGYGVGENYEHKNKSVIKDFRGRISRPFIQFTFGTAKRYPVMGAKTYGDIALTFRANYLFYNGYQASTQNGMSFEKQFKTGNFYYEPYIAFLFGGGRIKGEWGFGFPFKRKYEYGKDLTVYPFETNVGVVILLGRKYVRKLEYYFKEGS
ncbi:MAG: hypothetical protein HYY40_05915 [Bacteroidetes bacterium]|nr:hypothetical protein [Bacteroidota bacterium]